jgi:hypothetical protein
MFVIHGTFNSVKHRGVVAEQCDHCNMPTVQRLMQHYRSGHIYFIPLGTSLVESALVCTTCGAKVLCKLQRYSTTLPEFASRSLHVGDIMLRTNPQLSERVARVVNFENRAHELQTQNRGENDQRLSVAWRQLGSLDGTDPQVVQLEARLSQWHTFDAVGKADLVRDIGTLANRDRRHRSVVKILKQMVKDLKDPPDAFPQFFAFCFVVVAGLSMTVPFVAPSGLKILAALILSITAAIISSRWVIRRMERWRFRRFLRRQVLPEADALGITRSDLLAAISEIDASDIAVDPRLRRMAKVLPALKDLLTDREPDAFQPNPA